MSFSAANLEKMIINVFDNDEDLVTTETVKIYLNEVCQKFKIERLAS